MIKARDTPAQQKDSEPVACVALQQRREVHGVVHPESNVAQQLDLGIHGSAAGSEIIEPCRGDDAGKEVQRWEQDGGAVLAIA